MNKFYVGLLSFLPVLACAWNFSDETNAKGLNYTHGFDNTVTLNEPRLIAAGLGIGDINGDGWDDIFAVTGETLDGSSTNLNPNKLFIAQGDGTFVENASGFGLDATDLQSSAPLIVDINNDGFRDILHGSVVLSPDYVVYFNNGNAGFTKVNTALTKVNTFSTAAADIDKDGDLDLMVSHWLQDDMHVLWQNDGAGNFSDITITHMNGAPHKSTFSPAFSDINNDNWDDLLQTSDFSDSKYFLNDGTGHLSLQGLAAITDQNGMGVAVADYDNDGDFDWFVSAIYDPDGISEGNWGVTGNRLYQNDGLGNFHDVAIPAGVMQGYWGWGSCFADFNNDMYLDLFHVNGFPSDMLGEPEFVHDASRLFINNGDGTFTEMSTQLGINDTESGRAIICYDNERDGDIDILINNNQSASRFYQNNLDNNNNWLEVKLHQNGGNMDAIGAKISLTTGGVTQLRQVMAGASFASSNPSTQHFGLAQNTVVQAMTITWPDGSTQSFHNFAVNRYLLINKGQPSGVEPPQIIPVFSKFAIFVLLFLFVAFTWLIFPKIHAKNCDV